MIEKLYDIAADWIVEATCATAFSGAGVSAESGIATFRDPGGLWERFDPMDVGTASGLTSTFARNPGNFVGFMIEVMDTLRASAPNPGHRALGELEDLGQLESVITQNIDNLHQEGGSGQVIELHGNTFRLTCAACGTAEQLDRPVFFELFDEVFGGDIDPVSLLTKLPRCDECDAILRPDVVLFGEAVQRVADAFGMAEVSDLMMVLGTSGTVHPAAELPSICQRRGGRLVVINPNENSFEDLGGLYIPERTGVALPEITRRVRERLGG